MKMRKFVLSVLIALTLPLSAGAQVLPGKHPSYLHALGDLRAARWFLYHQPGDYHVSAHEDVAIIEIDAAISEIKRAAIEDRKDLNERPRLDVQEHGSRLLRSIETLRKARHDVAKEEDNPAARGLRDRATRHIDRAIKEAKLAHADWLTLGRR